MTESLFKLLETIDTPTVCNAIEVAQGKRGFNDFTKGTMISSSPNEKPICGYARTAKITALSPPIESIEAIKKRRLSYYEHMATANNPSVAVIEDIDFPNCVCAFWGEVNTNIHKGFGMYGACTAYKYNQMSKADAKVMVESFLEIARENINERDLFVTLKNLQNVSPFIDDCKSLISY